MGKEVLAVDIDEVSFPFLPEFAGFHNDQYGTRLQLDDFFCYDFDKVLNIDRDAAVERVYAFCGSDHSGIPPLPGAQAALERLRERFDLAVITARHPQFAESTRAWLDQHFAGHFASLTLIGYAAIMERPQRKVDVCQELGAVALIDDSLTHVRECAEAGMGAVLFGDYPWNQAEALPPGVMRCKDWTAVLEHFDVAA